MGENGFSMYCFAQISFPNTFQISSIGMEIVLQNIRFVIAYRKRIGQCGINMGRVLLVIYYQILKREWLPHSHNQNDTKPF